MGTKGQDCKLGREVSGRSGLLVKTYRKDYCVKGGVASVSGCLLVLETANRSIYLSTVAGESMEMKMPDQVPFAGHQKDIGLFSRCDGKPLNDTVMD